MASVADALGQRGITIETAWLAGDKLAMKKLFVEKGISIPWFCRVDSVAHLRRILSERGFPVVLKPVDSRGARGVLRLTESVDLDWAYEHSVSFSPSGRVMVEEYLEGPQISTESAIINGQAFTPGFTDRNYEFLNRFAPYIIENGGHYFFPEPGRVVKIKKEEQFRNTSWMYKLGFFVKPGDIVEPVTNHTKRAGFVITMGETRDQAIERAEQVVESIKIETVPVV